MRVTFWGAYAHSGATANMRAMAGMLKVMYSAQGGAVRGGNFGPPEKILFRDAGSGEFPGKESMWRQADLVVINLCRDAEHIERFFDRNFMLARKSFILLSSFPKEGGGSVAELVYKYRLEEEACGMIGGNASYYLAAKRGKSREFVEKEYKNPGSLRNEQFLYELQCTTKRMVRFANHSMETRNSAKRNNPSNQNNSTNQNNSASQNNSANQNNSVNKYNSKKEK